MSIRFTKAEQAALKKLAADHGKTVREWAREVLLRELQPEDKASPVFTELIAMRMLLNMTIQSIYLGEKGTLVNFEQILAEAKNGKHDTAAAVLKQYQVRQEGDR